MKAKFAALIVVILSFTITGASLAGQSEKQTYIGYCEEIGQEYNICPELLEAVIEQESNWDPDAVGTLGDTGLMQIVPKYHQERKKELGITDLKDARSNILVGTDYLAELFEKYDDPAMVLMAYNMGDKKAADLYNNGIISQYATDILNRSVQLERMNGK